MQIYLVGGAVRDRLLGRPVVDHDYLVVGATPEQMLASGFRQVGRDFPVFLHPETQEEYALARKEKKLDQGHHGFICDFGPEVTLEQDLIRRDLSINAMALNQDGELFDPYHGQADLQQRWLRPVSNAFCEDPLRLIRLARLHAQLWQFDFKIHDQSWQAMTQIVNSRELLTLSAERILQECLKAMNSEKPWLFWQALHQCGALAQLLPLAKFSSRLTSLPQGWSQLNHAQRLCWQFWQLHPHIQAKELQLQAKNLRFDKSSQTFLLDLANHHNDLNNYQQLSGLQRWQLLSGLDIERQPERLKQLQVLNELTLENQELLNWHLKQLEQVQAKELSQQGFKGKQLGLEMARRKTAILSKQA